MNDHSRRRAGVYAREATSGLLARAAFALCLALYCFGLPADAVAAVVELCGNGIDDVASTGGSANSGGYGACGAGYANSIAGTAGCDLLCPEPDKDNDGYTSTGVAGWAGVAETDCDDTNRRQYPGKHIVTGCTGSNYKTCQASGTYTSCQTGPLAEGDTNKYIDCASGNDSNAGTYASPYKTLGKVSGGAGGTPPTSPYTLTQDDYVYIIGSGTCSDTFTDGDGRVTNLTLNVAGTSGHPITIKQYPGATAVLANAGGVGISITGNADYYRILGLQASSNRGAASNGSTILSFGDYGYIEDVYVTGMVGHGDNNDSCILVEHSANTRILRNYLKDCVKGTGNLDNINAIEILDDTGSGAECSDHSVDGNTVWYSTFDDTANGSCFHQKHGCTLAEMGSNGLSFKQNTCINARRGLILAGAGVRATRNRFYSDPTATNVRLFTENGVRHGGIRIQYNSFLSGTRIGWGSPYYDGTEGLLYDHNIQVDTDDTYSAGNSDGVMGMDAYGSDAQKTTFESGAYLTANYNGYYCPNATCVFSYFSQTSGGPGPAGPAGADYSFANWKGTVGQDLNSFVENPTLDAYHRATSSNTSGFGWLLTSEEYTGPASTGTTTGNCVYNLLRRRR